MRQVAYARYPLPGWAVRPILRDLPPDNVQGWGARTWPLCRSDVLMNVREFTNVREFMKVSNAFEVWFRKFAEKREGYYDN